MRIIFKTIGINLLILIALLMIIDFCSMIIVDSSRLFDGKEDIRGELPNYDNFSNAKILFKEFNSLRSDYKSYYGWRRKTYNGETINIDSLGIRKTIGKFDKKNPTAVFLGGSTMWGTGASDENTIPSLFKRKSKINYNVLNYGESAYNAYQSLIFLQTQIAKNFIDDIDLIVTYDGVNNSYFTKNYFAHKREKQINNLLKGQDSKKEYLFMNNTKTLISEIKKIYSMPITPTLSNDVHKQAAIELLESWLMMKKLAVTENAKFVCILQPNAFVGDANTENIKNIIDNSSKDSYQYYSYVKLYLNTNDRYKVLKPHFIDMTNAFDNLPNVYIDFCHVSPNGNKIIVDNLLKRLN